MDMHVKWVSHLLGRSQALVVEFCDRCGRVCDVACRSTTIRERTIDQALRVRGGI